MALVVAVDQGSSGTKVQVLDDAGDVVGRSSVPVAETHPEPGWVEQDPLELAASVETAVAEALSGLDPADVVALGLTNQRESMVLWERATGRPLAPLVSWQDQRTVALATSVALTGVADDVLRISGLPLDPMFSALKARWLLDRYDPARTRARRGELCLGTVDSWLLAQLGAGHVVEIGNASRTQLLDLGTATWSPELLEIFDVPAAALGRITASDGDFRTTRAPGPIPDDVSVAAVLGDSHAALFGHGVRGPGPVKATYGTGSSVMTLGAGGGSSSAAMCRTIAWQRDGAAPESALEGNIRASGATLAWLGRLLGVPPAELASIAAPDAGGVHLVPAFNGLGAPWWDAAATGLISGLSLGTGAAELARAALESVAFQVNDVVGAAVDAGAKAGSLLADGGAAGNDVLMQFQADVCGLPVERSTRAEASALGVAHLAGLRVGLWDEDALAARAEQRRRFEPALPESDRSAMVSDWHDAVARTRSTRSPA